MIGAVNSNSRTWAGLVLVTALCQGCASHVEQENSRADPVAGEQPVRVSEQHAEREKAIQAYRQHLARFPDSPDYDAVTRRLADLLLDRASDPTVGGVDAAAGEDRAAASYREAIAAYEYLLGKSPGDAELLYQLSRAYEESGQPRQALAAVDQLLDQSRDESPRLRSDTLFRQGELLFDADEFAGAESAYAAVIALGEEAPAFEQSLYKLGWSLYMQGRYAEALAPFFAYLETLPGPLSPESIPAAEFSPLEREQVTELLDVISNCFAHMGGVGAAEKFFASGPPRAYERDIYTALARWYEEQQQISLAGETWFFLVQREPLARDAPTLAGRALVLYEAAGFDRLALATRHQFVDGYGPRSEFWSHHETADYPDESRLIEESLRNLGNYYHRKALDAPRAGYALVAERYYRDYLSWFGEDDAADGIRFQLAELLAEEERYAEAYDCYEDLAWAGGEETLAAAAALGALRVNAMLMVEAGPANAAALMGRGRDDAVRFVMTFPEHEAAPRILARVGGDLLDRGETQALADILGSVLAWDDGTRRELMLVAWTLNARAADAAADYPRAVEAYRSAIAHTAETDERYTALSTGLTTALLNAGRQSVERDAWELAGQQFEEATHYATDDGLRQSVHYAQASVQLAKEDWEAAAASLQAYERQYPDGAHRAEVSRKLAYAYEQGGATSMAAREYDALGQSRRQPLELRRQAILKAASLYDRVGDTTMAVEAREYYVAQFTDPVEASMTVMEELARLYSNQGNTVKQRYWLAAIVERDDQAGSAGTGPVAARAALELGELGMARFRQVRLVSPLEANLAEKIRRMEQALSDFERASAYGLAPVSSAATFHMASMYDELGRALLTSERPAGLTEDEREEYETLLAEQAAPLTQRAAEMYDLNVSRAPVDHADPWVQRSIEQRDALRNGREGLSGV